MTTETLDEVMRRARTWPLEAREELARLAREIESELDAGVYRPTAEELVGIDRGLRDAEQGRFATEREVEAVFAKHRRK